MMIRSFLDVSQKPVQVKCTIIIQFIFIHHFGLYDLACQNEIFKVNHMMNGVQQLLFGQMHNDESSQVRVTD